MLTYEEIRNKIIQSAKVVGLNPYNINDKIELRTLMKEFQCSCVLNHKNPPYITRAEISFSWDSILTAESIYGPNCALYHDESEDCLHEEENSEAFIELEITYNIVAKEGFRTETDLINIELINTFNSVMLHDNKPQIKWELTINSNGENRISSITAYHFWHFELRDDELEFEEVFEEVYEVLKQIEGIPFIQDNV